MTASKTPPRGADDASLHPIDKSPTGINGFDEVTGGGLPKGRPTLVCGGPGCGKTLFAAEFLVRGIQSFGEAGVFLAFEESVADLTRNLASLGHDLAQLRADKRLAVDYIHIDPAEIEESGGYSLDGLFVRLAHAVKSVGAKRVVIDSLEVLFAGLKNTAILRAEVARLFRWLRENELTAVVTAERGSGTFTRDGLEEYVSDCVILLDQRVADNVATRVLRIVKYRGSGHGTNEYPFLIDDGGVAVLPLTSLQLDYEVSDERISSGVSKLDEMLEGKGFFRASTVLLSGTAGTGKSTLAASAVDAACRRGERCILFALEESGPQIARNMKSVGFNLNQWIKKGLLEIRAVRPTSYGLEMHLIRMHKAIDDFKPDLVVLDPISSFNTQGRDQSVKAMLVRLFDGLKMRGVTGIVTFLTSPARRDETDIGISSLIDTWIEVRDIESMGERTRGLYVIKSRGMQHSNQVREFTLSEKGVNLVDVYVGADGILTGAARVMQDARDVATARAQSEVAARAARTLERKRKAMRAQIAALKAAYAADEDEMNRAVTEAQSEAEQSLAQKAAIVASRTGPVSARNAEHGRKGA